MRRCHQCVNRGDTDDAGIGASSEFLRQHNPAKDVHSAAAIPPETRCRESRAHPSSSNERGTFPSFSHASPFGLITSSTNRRTWRRNSSILIGKRCHLIVLDKCSAEPASLRNFVASAAARRNAAHRADTPSIRSIVTGIKVARVFGKPGLARQATHQLAVSSLDEFRHRHYGVRTERGTHFQLQGIDYEAFDRGVAGCIRPRSRNGEHDHCLTGLDVRHAEGHRIGNRCAVNDTALDFATGPPRCLKSSSRRRIDPATGTVRPLPAGRDRHAPKCRVFATNRFPDSARRRSKIQRSSR